MAVGAGVVADGAGVGAAVMADVCGGSSFRRRGQAEREEQEMEADPAFPTHLSVSRHQA